MAAEPVWDRAVDEQRSPFAAAVDGVCASVERLRAELEVLRSRGGAGGSAAVAALRSLDGAASLLDVVRAEVAAVAQRHARTEDLDGERDFLTWRSRTTRTGLGAARQESELGSALERLPELRDAVTRGDLTSAHAGAVARALGGASERASERLTEKIDDIVAAGRALPVPLLRRALATEVAAVESELADRSFAGARERRSIKLTTREGGIRLDGFLDPVAGEKLRASLDAVTPVPSALDERTGEQRLADALELLADRALGVGVDKVGAQVRPHVDVLVREETWAVLVERRRRAEADSASPVGRTATAFGATGLDLEPPLAETIGGTIVAFTALEVLTCDATTQRLVLDPFGVPLDVGTAERCFRKDVRRAVIVRDRHCQWPGCSIRASWCEIHHLRYWSHGGATSAENGIALCTTHHHQVHDRRVRILRQPGGFTFQHPDGRAIGSTTRLHDAVLVPRRPGGAAVGRGGRGGGGDSPSPSSRTEGNQPPPDGAHDDSSAFPDGCPAALW